MSEIGEEDPKEKSGNVGTITATERQIFERIFADIKARGLKSSIPDDASGKDPPTFASRSAMLIMQQAAQDSGQSRPATVPGAGLLAGAAKDRNKALLRFPPDLRAAASKALNAIDPSSAPYDDSLRPADKKNTPAEKPWTAPPHTFMRKQELDSKRQPERMRVEDLITSAKTDRELWDVLEAEVFTMPARMGIGKKDADESMAAKIASISKNAAENPEDVEPSHDKSSTANQELVSEPGAANEEITLEGSATEKTTAVQNPPKIPIPQEKMSLYVYGPLYPAYLLLALRRLDTAFRTSSPLALNILPRIKELGLESYVLGVSTPFYNELIDIFWSRYGDLPGMLDLLEEMRHCGLYFDQQTSSILGHAQGTLDTLAEGQRHSSFGAALMTMPQYETSMRNRIRHWHRIVDLSVEQRGDDLGY